MKLGWGFGWAELGKKTRLGCCISSYLYFGILVLCFNWYFILSKLYFVLFVFCHSVFYLLVFANLSLDWLSWSYFHWIQPSLHPPWKYIKNNFNNKCWIFSFPYKVRSASTQNPTQQQSGADLVLVSIPPVRGPEKYLWAKSQKHCKTIISKPSPRAKPIPVYSQPQPRKCVCYYIILGYVHYEVIGHFIFPGFCPSPLFKIALK